MPVDGFRATARRVASRTRTPPSGSFGAAAAGGRGPVRPDRCGTARRIVDLPDGDRQIVEGFRRFLRGEVAMVAATGEFVPLDRANQPGVVTKGMLDAKREREIPR